MALISELSKDLERFLKILIFFKLIERYFFHSCVPNGEIFVKSGKDYWIACKKSDLREVYVVVCQKNANLTMIDGKYIIRLRIYYFFFNIEEVKQLCNSDFSNIFFME